MERFTHPGSAYVRHLPSHLRTYESVLEYPPFQAYLGQIDPAEVTRTPAHHSLSGGERWGPYGEVMPEPEFLAVMKLVDAAGVVLLEEAFAMEAGYFLADHPLFAGCRIGDGEPYDELNELLRAGRAMPLYIGAKVAGVVMGDQPGLERLVVQAGAELAFRHLISRAGLQPDELYRLVCTEADFPAVLLDAAGLVAAGVHTQVAVIASNPPTGLGRHSVEQVAADSPVLEDTISVFAVYIGADDGVSPLIRPDSTAEALETAQRPLLWSLREQIMNGAIARWGLVGSNRRGWLERNPGLQARDQRRLRVGITAFGAECGVTEVVRGAELAQQQRPDLQVVLLGEPGVPTDLEVVSCTVIGPAHREMERRLDTHDLQAAVTVRYPFPAATALVDRKSVPGRSHATLLVTVACTAAAERVSALVRGAVCGAAVARTLGIGQPSIDLVSLEDGRQAEKVLLELQKAGWNAGIGAGGKPADVLVTDSCNRRESAGAGVGDGPRHVVCSIPPMAEAQAIAEAIGYAGDLARGGLSENMAAELAAARAAGLEQSLTGPLTV
jgi:hypothetical protein